MAWLVFICVMDHGSIMLSRSHKEPDMSLSHLIALPCSLGSALEWVTSDYMYTCICTIITLSISCQWTVCLQSFHSVLDDMIVFMLFEHDLICIVCNDTYVRRSRNIISRFIHSFIVVFLCLAIVSHLYACLCLLYYMDCFPTNLAFFVDYCNSTRYRNDLY